mmetsp:Transcript_18825/g.42958  ORF Transcript_18825/g.42958 Transcript_18825/m.42958 type:complete len:83 (-) Transcript_18825:85-333(-)
MLKLTLKPSQTRLHRYPNIFVTETSPSLLSVACTTLFLTQIHHIGLTGSTPLLRDAFGEVVLIPLCLVSFLHSPPDLVVESK